MRAAFIETLNEVAEKDDRIWLLTGDLGYSVLESFAQRFPDRYINVGVAEQNMTGIAAGLALCGKRVFTYSIGNFPTMRCLEQIRNDVCYHNLNVTIVVIGGGLAYGTAGYSHHAVEDLAVMRAIPNMTILAPGDLIETRLAIKAIAKRNGPCYLRLGRGGESTIHQSALSFEIGKAINIREGRDLTFIVTGSILKTVVEVVDHLASQGIKARVLSMHTVKPLDKNAIVAAARETQAIITVEEHSLEGGLGCAIANVLAKADVLKIPLYCLGISSQNGSCVGNQKFLFKQHGLSGESIEKFVLDMWAIRIK